MGKRSSFERRELDFYPTPYKAALPLIPHLHGIRTFTEPCCGDGALVRHLESFGLRCGYAGDIHDRRGRLARDHYGVVDAIITNPPHERELMHEMIVHFQKIAPTWLLIDQDWCATKQAIPYLGSCTDILAIGRFTWIPGTKDGGKDNFAWCRFDARHDAGPVYHSFRSPPLRSPSDDVAARSNGWPDSAPSRRNKRMTESGKMECCICHKAIKADAEFCETPVLKAGGRETAFAHAKYLDRHNRKIAAWERRMARRA